VDEGRQVAPVPSASPRTRGTGRPTTGTSTRLRGVGMTARCRYSVGTRASTSAARVMLVWTERTGRCKHTGGVHPEEGDELRFVGLWTVDFVSKTLALRSGVWTCRAARRLLDTTQRVRTPQTTTTIQEWSQPGTSALHSANWWQWERC
jgi:hypothetical protein